MAGETELSGFLNSEFGRRALVRGAATGVPALLLAACGASGAQGGQPPPAGKEAEKSSVVIGAPATLSIPKGYEQIKPLAAFLGQKSGLTIKTYVPADAGNALLDLASGKIDVTWLSPLLYVKSHASGQSDVLFKMQKKDASGKLVDRERALVLVRSDGAKALGELKDKVVASAPPDDVPGYLFPAWAVKKAGVDPRRDLKVDYRNSSDDAVLRLVVPNKQGKFDADAAFAGGLSLSSPAVQKAAPDVSGKTRQLATMDGAPLQVVVVRRGLHPTTVGKIRTAFKALAGSDAVYTAKDGQKSLLSIYGYDGIAEAQDSEYAQVREAAKALGITLAVAPPQK